MLPTYIDNDIFLCKHVYSILIEASEKNRSTFIAYATFQSVCGRLFTCICSRL